MIQVERRALSGELRADTTGRKLQGYAAVFNQDARIGGSFTERIAPGAFRDSLGSGADVLALADHDPDRLLARTRSGTLRLAEDARGLSFDLDVPDTQLGHDMLTLAVRGDIGGCSIGFRASRDSWPTLGQRVLHAIDLVEVSIVQAFPAYRGTSVQARRRHVPNSGGMFGALSPAARRRLIETL